MIGIYEIVSTVTGQRYVGSSVDVELRMRSHRSELNRNVHKNPKLQNAWNKYGPENFCFSLVRECTKEQLLEYEQHEIDTYDLCVTGYNVLPHAGNSLGRTHSDATRRKISQQCKGKKKPPFSAQHRRNMVEAFKLRPPLTDVQKAKRAAAIRGRYNKA